ncbi:glycosyltransferase family 4 protein, partial [Candidatus Bathyarchaeota archaeon]|nr:glycosyltransferase family 4 protein [Candidatus Bathyarchaeota archaeon]
MRVAVALIYPNYIGGGNKFTSDLCQMLKGFGHELALCAWEKPNENTFTGIKDIEFVYTPSWFTNQIKGTIWRTLYTSGSTIKKCIKEFKPDLIITTDLEPAVFYAVSDDIHKIHYCHFPSETRIKKMTWPYLLYRIPYWSQHYRQLSRLDYVVCNSNYTEKIAKILWNHCVKPNSFKVIYPTVDLTNFNFNRDKKDQICYVGRIDAGKGIDYVIDSFISFYDECKCDLKIIGAVSKDSEHVSYAKNLLKRVNELRDSSYPIELKTNVPYSDIIDTLLKSKLMLSFNPEEHFGIVPIEAQAAGCIP